MQIVVSPWPELISALGQMSDLGPAGHIGQRRGDKMRSTGPPNHR